jgi:hypothetical protein
MKRPRVYIASKMSGIPAFNFPAFDAMRVRLTNMGFDVVSPADIDREHGFDGTIWMINHPQWDWNVIPECLDYEEIMKRDFEAIKTCDVVVMFGPWTYSYGAVREKAHAEEQKIPVIDFNHPDSEGELVWVLNPPVNVGRSDRLVKPNDRITT